MKSKRIRIVLGLIIIFIIIVFYNVVISCPIDLKQDKIHSIFIGLELSSPEKSISGRVEIDDYNKIKGVIKVINGIKVSCGINLDKELEGDSPSAWINAYNKKGEKIDSVKCYYKILRYNDKFYKMSLSQYDKLAELCNKYGELQIE